MRSVFVTDSYEIETTCSSLSHPARKIVFNYALQVPQEKLVLRGWWSSLFALVPQTREWAGLATNFCHTYSSTIFQQNMRIPHLWRWDEKQYDRRAGVNPPE
jgi:hypothetical protein